MYIYMCVSVCDKRKKVADRIRVVEEDDYVATRKLVMFIISHVL